MSSYKTKTGNINIKKCGYCNKKFNAISKKAVFCSNSCRQLFYVMKKTHIQSGYSGDVNEGVKLAPGTIPSQEMPESKLIFKGNFTNLNLKLRELVLEDQLQNEQQYLKKLKPFMQVRDWFESSVQIIIEEDYMEVFRIRKNTYKLYLRPFWDDNEKPFV